jgi:hypothetical protein
VLIIIIENDPVRSSSKYDDTSVGAHVRDSCSNVSERVVSLLASVTAMFLSRRYASHWTALTIRCIGRDETPIMLRILKRVELSKCTSWRRRNFVFRMVELRSLTISMVERKMQTGDNHCVSRSVGISFIGKKSPWDMLQHAFPYSSHSPNVTRRELICRHIQKEEKFCDSTTKKSSEPADDIT